MEGNRAWWCWGWLVEAGPLGHLLLLEAAAPAAGSALRPRHRLRCRAESSGGCYGCWCLGPAPHQLNSIWGDGERGIAIFLKSLQVIAICRKS